MWISEFSLSPYGIYVCVCLSGGRGELFHLLSLVIASSKECVHRVSISMTKTMNDNESKRIKKKKTSNPMGKDFFFSSEQI